MGGGVQGKSVDLNEILKGVSRSFYLTLRALPKGIREPISLAYLLARASDTIADTETVSVDDRAEMLALYAEAAREGRLAEVQEEIGRRLVPYLPDDREALLMNRLAQIEMALGKERDDLQEVVRWVLGPIIEGQLWDLTYFPKGEVTQVESAELLERYTYLVAGSVGEFWTKVGFLQDENYATADRETMLRRGKYYGQALQLINILRDTSKDRDLGRIYLPDGDRKKWLAQARTWLDEGLAYSSNLPRWRLRMPTVLPALIGVETLDQLEAANDEDLAKGVKVNRKVIRHCLWQAAVYPKG